MEPSAEITRRQHRFVVSLILIGVALSASAALLLPSLLGTTDDNMSMNWTKSRIRGLETAAELFAQEHAGKLPEGTGPGAPKQLTLPGKDKNGDELGSYIHGKNVFDPWGSLLNYEYPSKHFPNGKRPAIWSNGPNQINEHGEGDDISNWKR